MKRSQIISALAFATIAFTACNNSDFKTTESGLQYKIIEGKGDRKDSLKNGQVLRVHVKQTISGAKDTVIQSTYDASPALIPIQEIPPGQGDYSPLEVFKQLRNGDSLIVHMLVDSLIMKGLANPTQLPPFIKRGEKIIYTFKVLGIYPDEATANAEAQKEEIAALEKSGEKAKQDAEVQGYVKSKGYNVVKSPLGTLVKVENPGEGAAAVNGKFLKVKYTGKFLDNDSTFDAGEIPVELGKGGSIPGFEDGLKQFKQGGKGTIFIPGYLAYGKDGRGGALKPYQPMYFDVEVLSVSDSMPPMPQQPMQMPMPNEGR
ncbi:FKBP-type peptidyl-prolyl cis-trans isomerase [Niabella ginsengisoli]|uniref:Peptidyl-prolyl cis-trans isomerase n=1 Tax=Niabella ginsengisoli TaxID=522298 RepID=A0ABS9SHM4_9BACT|nr:FKBP-type peptidyl-prolyl cis-trans isomerase [Niabella ginsengisoli]MCH5597863.1 FKBP-type peptidyl-prolyl cis-trans isomerase [Niabella ginsengisoli]